MGVGILGKGACREVEGELAAPGVTGGAGTDGYRLPGASDLRCHERQTWLAEETAVAHGVEEWGWRQIWRALAVDLGRRRRQIWVAMAFGLMGGGGSPSWASDPGSGGSSRPWVGLAGAALVRVVAAGCGAPDRKLGSPDLLFGFLICVFLYLDLYFAHLISVCLCLIAGIRVIFTLCVLELCSSRTVYLVTRALGSPSMVFVTPIWPELSFGAHFLREFMPMGIIRVIFTLSVLVLCRIRFIIPRMVFVTPMWPEFSFGTPFLRESIFIFPIWYSDTLQEIMLCKRIITVVSGFGPQSLVGDPVLVVYSLGVFCNFNGFVCLFHGMSLFRDLYAVMDIVQFKD